MLKIEEFEDSKYEEILRPIWDFLAVKDNPMKSDIIFVFGGLDFAVPRRAAELFLNGLAPKILVSGSFGPYSKDVFNKAEAYVFKDEIMKNGIPDSVILIEDRATNALENVLFGMEILKEKNIKITSAILISKPFMMRRSLATFQKQFPDISLYTCPPKGNILEFCDRSKHDFAKRLIAELDRLKKYAEKGDIKFHEVPNSVVVAAEYLQKLL